METPVAHSAKLQWKWVAITFVAYVIFYVFPIAVASGTFAWFHASPTADVFLGIWVFSGIIVVAGAAAFFSQGITIWEPAIAGGALAEILLGYNAIRIISTSASHRFTMFQVLVPIVMITTVVFLLSVFGAWLGEWAQTIWRPNSESPQNSSETDAG